MNTTEFPKSNVVWPGAILGSIVNSIMTAVDSSFQSAQGWMENTYWVDGWDGRYAAITFDENNKSLLVGIAFSTKSERRITKTLKDFVERYFTGCPTECRKLADSGALKFWQQENRSGQNFTTAFWSKGDLLNSTDTWSDFLEHGGDLLEIQLMEHTDEAFQRWVDDYEMSEDQTTLARSLFNRKVTSLATVHLTLEETSALKNMAQSPDAFESSCNLLKELNILSYV